jgi:hypothetical protein
MDNIFGYLIRFPYLVQNPPLLHVYCLGLILTKHGVFFPKCVFLISLPKTIWYIYLRREGVSNILCTQIYIEILPNIKYDKTMIIPYGTMY